VVILYHTSFKLHLFMLFLVAFHSTLGGIVDFWKAIQSHRLNLPNCVLQLVGHIVNFVYTIKITC